MRLEKIIAYPILGNLSTIAKLALSKKWRWFNIETAQLVSAGTNILAYPAFCAAYHACSGNISSKESITTTIIAGVYGLFEGVVRIGDMHSKKEAEKEIERRSKTPFGNLGKMHCEDLYPGSLIGKIVSLPYDIFCFINQYQKPQNR